MKATKMKTIHEVVTHNGVVVSERTFEVVDHDAYWYLDYAGQPKPEGEHYGFTFDKEDHPLLSNAQDAFAAWEAKRRLELAEAKAARRPRRRKQRTSQ